MKKIFLALAASAALMACGSNNNNNDEALKAQHSMDSMKMELARQHIVDSMNAASRVIPVVTNQEIPVVATPAQPAEHRHRHHQSGSYTGNYPAGTATTTAPAQSTVPAEAAPTPHKKGWSDKAKGAVIGVGAGALTGAIVDKKNRGAGAVIGGAIGGVAGLGAGAILDKKKKKKAQEQ